MEQFFNRILQNILRATISTPLLLVWIATLPACSVVEIHAPGPVSVVHRKFGILRLEVEGEQDFVAVKSRGIGFVPMLGGFAVGRAEEIMVVTADSMACRTVIFSQDSMPLIVENWDWLLDTP